MTRRKMTRKISLPPQINLKKMIKIKNPKLL